MDQLASIVRKRVFGIDSSEVDFVRRGFSTRHPDRVRHLERVGGAFVAGYQIALAEPEPIALGAHIDRAIEPGHRGFAFEGAGMALALLDLSTPWRRDRLQSFLAGPGDPHTYMVHIGAGWAYARMRVRMETRLQRLDPVLRWLALDGYGFHEGFFHPEQSIDAMRVPARVRGYAREAFDTGLGRSLWFVQCADPDDLARTIERFDASRRPNLWAGAGLACTYAGGVTDRDIERVAELAGRDRGSLAQGSAFAAKARERAGIPTPHTERAVRIICATSAELAAKVCDRELAALTPEERSEEAARSARPGFERWRAGIRETLLAGIPTSAPHAGADDERRLRAALESGGRDS